MAKTWIKLFTEALHDRKMRKLSRFDKSVFYDLLLLAGQEDQGGLLPDIGDIALELDLKKSEVLKSLNHLADYGMVTITESGNVFITNFEKRQMSVLSEAEKKAIYRDKKRTKAGQMSDECPTESEQETRTEDGQKEDSVRTDVQKMSTIETEADTEAEFNTVNANALTDARGKNSQSEKMPYGQFGNVMLTNQEYASLCEKFPDADSKIEAMSQYFESHGNAKKYKSHYATALNWARMAAERDSGKKKPASPQGESWLDIADRIVAENPLKGGEVIDL